jgi:prepilin-type N-terminal cleavage/methylation domain-containing protein
MHTEACQNRGVIKAFTATVRSAANNSAAQHGFTLVELLVGVALGSMVMSGLGTLMMLSEVRVSANIQRNFELKDALNRTTDLMRREATFASFIATGFPFLTAGTTPLDDCVGATPIRLAQRNNINDICYKSVNHVDLPDAYQAIYKGPCVLVRIGPPYKPNDELDSSAASNPQVLLDGVSCAYPFLATLGVKNQSINSIHRNADITITMDSPRETYKFSLRSPSSPAYDGLALYDLCTSISRLGCGPQNSTTYHYKPFMNSTNEVINNTTSEKENLFYFEYPFSEYALSKDSGSGTCSYSQCYVSRKGFAVKMIYVNGLIFADKEIRVFDAP